MPKADPDGLARYRARRDFRRTTEPSGRTTPPPARLRYVIQKHDATRLHYDLRLELDGLMLSWAVPRGPSLDPDERRLAVEVEPHPIDYRDFEGDIPAGQYGAGRVIIWDRGYWRPIGDPHQGLGEGKLLFELIGLKLRGRWELIRPKPRDPAQARQWLLFKKRDADARTLATQDVLIAQPDSVGPAPQGQVGPLPARIEPQLAGTTSHLPTQDDWLYEIKFDGYRLGARIEQGTVRLLTRGAQDWTDRLPGLGAALAALPVTTAWLDGEITVPDAQGVPDFAALQNAFDSAGTSTIVFHLFDCLYLDGQDLRGLPLRERRLLLVSLLRFSTPATPDDDPDRGPLRFSAHFDAEPDRLIASARALGLEGLMAKRADAPYTAGRSGSWLKLKWQLRQEFVIVGYTDRAGDPAAGEVGSLLLAVRGEQQDEAGTRNPVWVSVGSVGTGWDAAMARRLKALLRPLEIGRGALMETGTGAGPGKGSGKGSGAGTAALHRVRPEKVVEVRFGAWSRDQQLRHAVFVGLREDRDPASIRREVGAPTDTPTPVSARPPTRRRAAPPNPAGSLRITHPERVIDPSTGLTKRDLVRYYESVADRLLPHLAGRPCSLVRGPAGVGGQLFFQKHPETLSMPGLIALDPGLWPDHEALIEVRSADAIVGLAQMNVIEFHTWNCRARRIDRPDRMIFDLDPGEGVGWDRIREAALLTRSLLADLGLAAWLKTSGGKGLHVVVPLSPRHPWAVVRACAQALVAHMARIIPDRFTARSGPTNRVGRIFIDHLRNQAAATTVAAYSARARPGVGVSMPVTWEAIDTLRSGAQWSITDARDHLSFHPEDPWAALWTQRQTLTLALRRLEVVVPED